MMAAALQDEDLLRGILSFGSTQDWAFASTISKIYLKAYVSVGGTRATSLTASFASVSRLQLAKDTGLKLSKRAQHVVAGTAGIAQLQAAVDIGLLQWTPAVAEGAAASGSLETLQWLSSQRCPFPGDICNLAASSCRAPIAKINWLQDCGFAVTPDTLLSAVQAGALPVVQHLHAEGCSWHWRSSFIAASSGDLNMLRWYVKLIYIHTPLCSVLF
jgi:hypothetical protein